MSLRVFHIVFILAAAACCDFFAFWAVRHYLIDKASQAFFWEAIGAFVASFLLLIYLLWFICIQKIKSAQK